MPFEVTPDAAGWSAVHSVTRRIALIRGHPQENLSLSRAIESAELLNCVELCQPELLAWLQQTQRRTAETTNRTDQNGQFQEMKSVPTQTAITESGRPRRA
jgi:hypothetical protein